MHDEIEIKNAVPEDAPDIAKIHVDCWKSTYAGIVPDEKLNGLSYEKSGLKWKEYFEGIKHPSGGIIMALLKGVPVGFCAGGIIRKTSKRTSGYEGEIKAIYILKEYQRVGIGKKLIKKYGEIFQKNKIFSYIIWVLKENDSRHFYKKMGGKLITTKTYEIGGKKLKGLCYGFKMKTGTGNEF